MTVETYLHTSFENPDREYWDGNIVRRTPGDWPHSTSQVLLCWFFGALSKTVPCFPRPSLRLRLGPRLILVPDVCVFHPVEPSEPVPSDRPFVVIEVLSREDRMTHVREKLEHYVTWGVPHVWLADPYLRLLYECAP